MAIDRTEKRCSKCKTVKPISEYHRHAKQSDGHHSRCKPCTAVSTAARQQDPKWRAYQREHKKKQRQENPDRQWDIRWRSYLKRVYGMTALDYAAMFADQDGKCATCGTHNPGTRRRVFDIDHCHTTGKIRGLLCHPCNKALGFARDNPAVLIALANYLEKSRCLTPTGAELPLT